MITESKVGRRTKLWNCLVREMQRRKQNGLKFADLDHVQLAEQIAIVGHSERLWTEQPETLADSILDAPGTPPKGDQIFELELNICLAEIGREWDRELDYLFKAFEPNPMVPRFQGGRNA